MGRKIIRGVKSSKIFFPLLSKLQKETLEKQEKEDEYIIYGYKAVSVFALNETVPIDPQAKNPYQLDQTILEELNFTDVSKTWGIDTYYDFSVILTVGCDLQLVLLKGYYFFSFSID